MAVDVIPGKDDTLALIEFVRGELERTLSEIERNKEKLFIISIVSNPPISLFVKSLGTRNPRHHHGNSHGFDE